MYINDECQAYKKHYCCISVDTLIYETRTFIYWGVVSHSRIGGQVKARESVVTYGTLHTTRSLIQGRHASCSVWKQALTITHGQCAVNAETAPARPFND